MHDPIIPGYQLYVTKILGMGSQGTVYRAVRKSDGLEVAIKVFLTNDLVGMKRVEREISVNAKLRSRAEIKRYFVNYLEHNLSHNPPYLVMSLINGLSLQQYLERDQAQYVRRDEMACKQIAIDLLQAIAIMHKARVIHRDLKPANIIVETLHDEPKRVVLVDFGIAIDLLDRSPPLTEVGQIVGTQRYMAPEIFYGERGSEQSDQFSLGLIISELVYGNTLPLFEKPYDQLKWSQDNLPLHKNAKDPLERTIRRCTQFSASYRFSSYEFLLQEIKGQDQASHDIVEKNSVSLAKTKFSPTIEIPFTTISSVSNFVDEMARKYHRPFRIPTDQELEQLIAANLRTDTLKHRELARSERGDYFIIIPKNDLDSSERAFDKLPLFYSTFPPTRIRLCEDSI